MISQTTFCKPPIIRGLNQTIYTMGIYTMTFETKMFALQNAAVMQIDPSIQYISSVTLASETQTKKKKNSLCIL